MMDNIATYTPGDIAYIVANKRFVREVQILSIDGDLFTLRFTDSGGGIKVRSSRLFPTKAAAEATVPKKQIHTQHPHLGECQFKRK